MQGSFKSTSPPAHSPISVYPRPAQKIALASFWLKMLVWWFIAARSTRPK